MEREKGKGQKRTTTETRPIRQLMLTGREKYPIVGQNEKNKRTAMERKNMKGK